MIERSNMPRVFSLNRANSRGVLHFFGLLFLLLIMGDKMSTMQKAINYADALQNANKIIETFQKPVDSKTSLDGLDATIAAISLAETGASVACM